MCGTEFFNSFGISAKYVRHAAQGSSNLHCCSKVGGTGRQTKRIHAVKEDVVETMEQCIGSSLRYSLHGSQRDNSHKTYTTSVNSVEDMYRKCISVFATDILILLSDCLDLIFADNLMNTKLYN